MPEFDDVILPAHYRPQLDYSPVSTVERYTVLLKDGETTATIYPIHNADELPAGLLAFLCDEFNMEVERGDTFSFFDTLHIESFQNYWFGAFAGVMVLGDSPTLEGPKQWEKECLGTFFIKPNYPGRASHICTAGFLVNAGIRGKGIGRTLTDCFLQWAPRIGYTYTVFNLVFETNVAARRIWELLNFKRIGRVKSAGILKGHETAVDAIIYGRELVTVADTTMGAYRFDRIRFYLETGKYPAMSDRLEKSRLRLSASHYRLEDGKLKLRDREVVSDPVRQLQICTEIHMASHGGINKTTAAVTEKYHWTRIKDTVSAAIKNCVTCSESAKDDELMKLTAANKRILHGLPDMRRGLAPGPPKPPADEVDIALHARDDSLHRGSLHRDTLRHQDSLHRDSLPQDSLLPHDLSGLDNGLIAVVEAAQKRQLSPRRQQHHESPAPTYASVAAAAVGGDANQFYANDYLHHAYTSKYSTPKQRHGRGDTVPVDPDISVFDHNVNAGGEEIEIARALIHSNEVDEHADPDQRPEKPENGDETNMFFKND